MDRRSTERARLRVDAVLYRDGVPVALCRTRDLSCAGAFLETDARLAVPPPGEPCEVGLKLDWHGLLRRFRLPARVVHPRGRGIGVAFLARSRGARRAVHALVQAHRRREARIAAAPASAVPRRGAAGRAL